MSKEVEKFLELPQVHKDWIDAHVVMSAFGQPPSLYATAVLTFKVLEVGLRGDFCECGVAAGVHPAVMHYCQRFMFGDLREKFRPIYMFDSYEGIPKPTVEDIPTDDHPGLDIRRCVGEELATPGVMETTGITAVPLAEVQQRMARWGADARDLHYVVGWFQDTVPSKAKEMGDLATLRIDGDLYESTKVCMEHIYPKVVRGGFVVIDDWDVAGVRRAVAEYFGETPRVQRVPGVDHAPAFWRKTR